MKLIGWRFFCKGDICSVGFDGQLSFRVFVKEAGKFLALGKIGTEIMVIANLLLVLEN